MREDSLWVADGFRLKKKFGLGQLLAGKPPLTSHILDIKLEPSSGIFDTKEVRICCPVVKVTNVDIL